MLKTELRKIFNNKILLLSIFVILFVPILYAGIFLKAVWNPQSHTNQLLVGVVNEDHTVNFEGKQIDIGHKLVDHLKDNKSVNWQFVSADVAKRELKGGDYYMVVTIPENFSKNATTMLNDHPEKMQLYFETNHTKSKSAENVMLTVSDKVTDNIKEQIIKAYSDTMAENFSKLGHNMSQASNGATKISDGLVLINNKMPEMTTGVNQLSSGSLQLSNGLMTYSEGVNTLSQGLNQADASINSDLLPATQQLLQGFQQASSGQQQLLQGNQKLTEGQQQFHNKFEEFNQHIQQLPDATQQMVSASSKLTEGSQKINSTAKQLLSGQQQFSQGLNEFNHKHQEFSSGMMQLNEGVNSILVGEQQVQTGLDELLKQAQITQEKFKHVNETMSVQNLQELTQVFEDLKTIRQQSNDSTDIQTTLDTIQQSLTNLSVDHQNMLSDLQANDTFKSLSAEQQNAIIESLNQSYQSSHVNDLTAISQNLSQLIQNLQTNTEHYHQLQTKLNKLDAIDISQLPDILSQVIIQDDQAVDSIAQLKQGQDKIVQATTQLSEGITQLSEGNQQLSQATVKLTEGAQQLTDGTNQYINEGTEVLQNNMTLFNDTVAQLPNHMTPLTEGSQKLFDANGQLLLGQQQLSEGVSTYTTGVNQLSTGFTQYSQGIDKLSSGINQLSNGSYQLVNHSPQLISGGQQLADGLSQMENQLPQLSSGLHELSSGADKLQTGLSAGANKLNQIHISSANTDMLADPVISNISDVTGKTAKYGELMAPYFLALGLYIGAMIFNLIYPVTLPSMQPTSAGAWWRSKLVVMTLFVILEVIIELIVMSTLFDMNLAHPILYAVGLFTIAYTFMLLIHFLVFSFDNPGRFIAMILLILQLSSSGGMFPIEMTPDNYQFISSFMPMYYALAVLRHAILGGLTNDIYYSSLIVLLTIIVVSMVLTYVMYRIKNKKNIKPLQMI